MKFLKFLFITILVLLLLSASAAYVIVTRYKKELSELFIQKMKDDYGVNVKVADIRVSFFSNWPHASVQLKNVEVSSDRFPESYIKAGGLGLSFNMNKLLHQQFIVQNVSISNAEIIFVKPQPVENVQGPPQPEDTTKSNLTFEIKKIAFHNTKLRYLNPRIGQQIAIDLIDDDLRLEHYSDGIHANLQGRLYIPGLLFHQKRGEFLKESKARVDLEFDFFKADKSICIRPGSTVNVNGHHYNVSALIDLGEKRRLALMINSKKVDVAKTSRLLNPKIRKVLSNYELKKPIDVNMLMVVNLGKKEDPILIIDFEGKNNSVKIGNSNIPYSRLAFQGRLVCLDASLLRGNMDKARLTLKNVKGRVFDLPFTANIRIHNFADPYISIKGKLNVDASKFKSRINDEFVLKGQAIASVSYAGPTSHLNTSQFLDPIMKLKADIDLKDVSYREIDKPWVYTINGMTHLDNKDLTFNDLRIKSDVGDATASGRAEDFLDYIFGNTNGFKANLAVTTESLDLNPFLKQQHKLPIDTVKVLAASVAPDLSAPEKTTAMMSAATAMKKSSTFEFNVGLFAKNMRIREVTAKNAHMHLHYLRNVLDIHSIAANVCEGKIKGRATVKNYNDINADLIVEEVDVQELFKQFENFGQEALVSDNLQGKISAEASFKSLLDDRMEIAAETMFGEVKLTVTDGHLMNFSPLQDLSKFLFKNRDFKDVSFSEINQRFVIRGYEMQIEELEVGSSVFNLYVVNGFYNFKGNSNINLLVPWSNLKRRNKDFVPKSSGVRAEDAKGVKLNVSGPPKQMRISLGHKELTQTKPSI